MNIKRTVYGVGYLGVGDRIASINQRHTPTYKAWYNMMSRCYSKELHSRLPQYINCEASDEWKCFQNFAEWYEDHEFSGLGYHLDKDLLIADNKIYSAETCCFLPQEINKLITSGRMRSGSLQGAYFSEQSKSWISSITKKNKVTRLGSFKTEIEAHLTYVEAKELLVRESARAWFGKIETKAYEKLINWSFEPKVKAN